jgi:hypothetical protein
LTTITQQSVADSDNLERVSVAQLCHKLRAFKHCSLVPAPSIQHEFQPHQFNMCTDSDRSVGHAHTAHQQTSTQAQLMKLLTCTVQRRQRCHSHTSADVDHGTALAGRLPPAPQGLGCEQPACVHTITVSTTIMLRLTCTQPCTWSHAE